jgi:hypothetical protein
VSRSVSGYSCLSYNNGVPTNTTSTNGSSSCTNGSSPYSQKYVSPGSGKVRSEFTIRVNQPQTRHHHRLNDDDDDMLNNVEGRLIRSPTSPNQSKYSQDESEDPSERDPSYVPSHGKSFIMQRIERLYGSEAVSAASVFSRSSVSKGGSTTTTTIKCETLLSSPGKGKERVIPIQMEKDEERDETDRGSERSSEGSVIEVAKEQGYERVIRGDEILIKDNKSEDNDNNESLPPQTNNNNSGSMKSARLITDSTLENLSASTNVKQIENGSESTYYEGVALESCPGKHKLHTISLEGDERQSLLISSSKMKNGDSIRPVTSPSPIKKSTMSQSPALDRTHSVATYKDEPIHEGDVLTASANVGPGLSSTSDPPISSGSLEVAQNEPKNGIYFIKEMNKTKEQLAFFVEKFGKEVETVDESTEQAGNILSAIGKANLLMKKKFKQFEELCNANLVNYNNSVPSFVNNFYNCKLNFSEFHVL